MKKWGMVMLLRLLFFITAVAPVWAATLRVPEDINTIQSAVDGAQPGDVIEISSGTHDGPVTMRSGITLRGVGGEVTISNTRNSSAVLLIDDCSDVAVEGIAFDAHSESTSDDDDLLHSAATAHNSSATFSNCRFTGGSAAGVDVSGSSKVQFQECTFSENESFGLDIHGLSQVSLDHCTFSSNQVGAQAGKFTEVEFISCAFKSNDWDGFHASDVDFVTIAACVFESNGRNGVLVDGCEELSITKSEVISNGSEGLYLAACSQATISQVTSNSNESNGICVRFGTKGTINDSVFEENEGSGIWAGGFGTEVELHSNRTNQNWRHGVFIGFAAKAYANANTVIENEADGIRVAGIETFAKVMENTCRDNGEYEIVFNDFAQGTASKNAIDDGLGSITVVSEAFVDGDEALAFQADSAAQVDYWVDISELPALLHRHEFDHLNKVGGILLERNPRYSAGSWMVPAYLHAISNGENGFNETDLEALEAAFAVWRIHSPASYTRVLAEIDFRHQKAYVLCKNQDPREVSESLQSAQEAWECLEEAEKFDSRHPVQNQLSIGIGLLLRKPMEFLDLEVERAAVLDPAFAPVFEVRAIGLTPHWDGKRGQVDAFASSARELAGEHGDQIYAQIAVAVYGYMSLDVRHFELFKLEWEQVLKGYESLMQQFPESNYYRNSLALAASIHEEKQTAALMFQQIGVDWDRNVWSSRKGFESFRAWALEDGAYPKKIPYPDKHFFLETFRYVGATSAVGMLTTLLLALALGGAVYVSSQVRKRRQANLKNKPPALPGLRTPPPLPKRD